MCDCDYDLPELYSVKTVKVRKPHRCVECRITIEPGQQADKIDGLWDGKFSTLYTCLECATLIDYLLKRKVIDCFCHGDLREAISEEGLLYSDDDIEQEYEHLPFYDERKGVVRGSSCPIVTKVPCIVIRQGKLRLKEAHSVD